MRRVRYKAPNSKRFKIYIDIGSCDRDFYFINFFLPGEHETRSGKLYFENYESWFDNFKNESIGSKMIILHWYLSEYMGWSNSENTTQKKYFEENYGTKTLDVIEQNLDFFLKFHDKWFLAQTSLFSGLDLDWDDIEDRFANIRHTKKGNKSRIEFDDGSVLSFLDEDDSVNSFYVFEDDYQDLIKEVDLIVNKFKP